MFKAKLFTDKYEIISSGSAISFNSQPIMINFEEDEKKIFEIIFLFRSLPDSKEPAVNIKAENDNFTFTLTNFNNPLGTGSTKPISFGLYKGKEMFLHYRVHALGESDKTLHYTLYLAKETGNE